MSIVVNKKTVTGIEEFVKSSTLSMPVLRTTRISFILPCCYEAKSIPQCLVEKKIALNQHVTRFAYQFLNLAEATFRNLDIL